MGKMLRVIRPCHRVMVPGARQNLHRLQRQGWDVGVLQLSTPQLSWGWAPGRTSRTQHSKCMPPVPSVPPCCDGDHAEQGESTRPNESPDKVLGHRRVVRQGEAAAPHPLQPPSCLPMGCRVATNASHHTAGSLLAQEGSVRWDGEPEPCGVGVQETCSGVYQPLQSQNRKPPQPEIAAGREPRHSTEGSLSTAALLWLHQPCRKSNWSQGSRTDPCRLSSPTAAPQGRRQRTQPRQSLGRQRQEGARREHPTPRHSPHTLLPAWLCSARTFPHLPLRFPVECRKGLCSSWGVTVNGTTCSLRGNSSAGQGHGDTWEQALGHLLPASCQETQARALQQSPGLAVVVPAAGPGQDTAAWAGGGAGMQLYVPRVPQFHKCPSS